MFTWLRHWWMGNRDGDSPPVDVILYTRRGCHLCDDVWQQLESEAKKYRLRLQSQDVDDDAGLRAKFGLEVPVVVVNGKLRFRGRINPVLLERLLRKECETI